MKVLQVNRKADFDFFIEEKFTAGMILEGWMVKAILAGRCNIGGMYVKPAHARGFDELVTVGLSIIPLENSKVDVSRGTDVSLLLNAREIKKIIGSCSQKGYSIIPVELQYHGKRGIKLVIALAKGKKNYDKRDAIKQRDLRRETNE